MTEKKINAPMKTVLANDLAISEIREETINEAT